MGRLEGDMIRLRVSNTMPLEAQPVRRSGNSMALENVRQRVDAFFEGAARFEVDAQPEQFAVSLDIPYRKRGE